MPLVSIWTKASKGTVRECVDAERLIQFLCPYKGHLTRRTLANSDTFTTELAGGETDLLIPSGTTKPANSAWLAVEVDEDGYLRFTTDPLGTFPLWVYEDERVTVVTSEVKSLKAIPRLDVRLRSDLNQEGKRLPPDFSPYENLKRVVPGSILKVSPAGKARIETRQTLNFAPKSHFTDEAAAKKALFEALQQSASEFQASAGGWGVFLSGGIDSSVATALLVRADPHVIAHTLGTEFGDEYADAGDLCASLGIRQVMVRADASSAREHFQRAVHCNEAWDGLTVETLAQLSVLAAEAAPSVKHIATGYGSDLLFGSMLTHELYMKVTGVSDLQSLIERTMWTAEFSPFFAWSFGVNLHHLFWHPAVMNTAFRIPAGMNADGPRDKMVLRNLAREHGLVTDHQAFRKKQALTDGTQFNRLLSSAFGLQDCHAYGEKGRLALMGLRTVVEK